MEIIVVSDTHNDKKFIQTILKKHPNAYKYLHAGDSCLTPNELYPFESVKGNCDNYVSNIVKVVSIKDKNILMFHGDKFSLDDNMLIQYANNYNAIMVIHGHTHIPRYRVVDGIHILCPGSLILPRMSKPSYAIIYLNELDYKINVEICKYEYK